MLTKFFFLLTFAAAIPAIVSGGVAERAKMLPLLLTTFIIVSVFYPLIEGVVWNGNFGIQAALTTWFGVGFHDFAGSIVVHAFGGWVALAVGGIAGGLFVWLFTFTQNKLKLDDVLGVVPLHGVCGLWGGIAVGIFGQHWLGGHGGVSFVVQLIGSLGGVLFAVITGFAVYGIVKKLLGLRLTEEEEFNGADLTIHKISSTFNKDMF